MGIQQDEKINCLGLTNFDTKHMLELIEEGAPIVSNQVWILLNLFMLIDIKC